MNHFLILALLSGILLSIPVGPIGSLVIWNRLSYLGDSVAHASLLGIVSSLILNINPILGSLFITIMTLLLFINYHSEKYPIDTILAIFSYSSLSLSLIIYSLSDTISINLESLLFGDILAISEKDLAIIALFSIFALTWLKRYWGDLILMTLDSEMAITNNINSRQLKIKLILLVSLMIILSIKAIGILLISSLIVIPAAAARALARSPESMAITASLISIISVILGLLLSSKIDTPSGPSIILINGLTFFIMRFIQTLKKIKLNK